MEYLSIPSEDLPLVERACDALCARVAIAIHDTTFTGQMKVGIKRNGKDIDPGTAYNIGYLVAVYRLDKSVPEKI